MPKQKTNKSVTKRMKITATGKVKHHRANRRHLLNNRTSKVKRQSRGTVVETGRVARKYIWRWAASRAAGTNFWGCDHASRT